MSQLKNQIAIVTGGAKGIGQAISQRFALEGARVALFDFDEESAAESASAITETGGTAAAFACDVSDSASVSAAIDALCEKWDSPDMLINNAGIAHIGTATSTSESDFERVLNVNVKGAYHCLRHTIPLMQKKGGGIILNMSSVAAVAGLPDRFAYSASKGAIHTMTLSVAADYLEDGIRCNCICPARVHTPFVDGYLDKNYPDNREEMFQKLSEAQPIGRMAHPEEIANLALYLCSDQSSFITGQAFPIDGGYMNIRK